MKILHKNTKQIVALYKKYLIFFESNNRNPIEFFIILGILLNDNPNKLKQKYINKELNISFLIKYKLLIIFFLLKMHYPWEYFLKKVFFNGNFYYIKRPVFIPREDTLNIIKIIKQTDIRFENILELGIGSGIILNEIAKLFPNAVFIGIEMNKKSIQVAKINCGKIKKLQIVRNNWCLDYYPDTTIDLLISNPPYVLELSSKNLLESKKALFGNKASNFIYYKEIIVFANEYLSVSGYCILEIPKYYLDKVLELIVVYKIFKVDIIYSTNPVIHFLKIQRIRL